MSSDPRSGVQPLSGVSSRRTMVRVKPAEEMGLIVNLVCDDKNYFDVLLDDIGAGGCAVRLPEGAEPWRATGALELTIHWCIDQKITLKGVVRSVEMHPGRVVCHVLFDPEHGESMRAVSALVLQMERWHLRARSGYGEPGNRGLSAPEFRKSPARSRPCLKC
ncbi:MAG: PilZ domain-containing protein [Magnetococcales bacterium]|nr:PilZ domain-containing protein [Magnetococcales bacterium]